jgi:GT2 family glycosyltransferase/ADP-heptose:LPS heptosyltransferase/predicted SAM-dependent methyltransferase
MFEPVEGVEKIGTDDGQWNATTEDPQFELALVSERGWQWVRFLAEVEPSAAWRSGPALYVDSGAGYSEADAVVIAAPASGACAVDLIFALPPGATRIRFDPLAQRGPFRLRRPELRRLSRAGAFIGMAQAVAGAQGWRRVLGPSLRAVASLDLSRVRQVPRAIASAYRGLKNLADPVGSISAAAHATVNTLVMAGPVTPVTSSALKVMPRRIQVHRRNALGDVLLITPVLRELRKTYRHATITVTTLYPTLLTGNPDVDEVLRAGVPLPGFDLTIDLQYEHQPELHIVDAYAQIAGVTLGDRTPALYLTQADLENADAVLSEAGVRLDIPLVAFHIESGWKVRDWSVDGFRTVAEALGQRGAQVVVLGERPTAPIDFGIDLRGKTTLRSLAAVVFKCDALLSIDSGVMHLAAALRRPFVGLFGCTDPDKRVPDWARSAAVYADIVCHGCHHRQRPVPVTSAPVCPFESVRCMEEITTARVLDKLLPLLETSGTPRVSIVIPHYRGMEVLERCLASLFREGAAVPFEVIVVDDSGTGEDSAGIAAWAPRVRLVRNERNLGFSRSCNAGVEAARGEFVVLLNNDTTVTAGWLDHMLALLESDPRAAMVGPRLLYPGSEAIQHCGTVINENGVAEHLYRFLPGNLAGANRLRRYGALTGACLLVRRRDLLAVGGLDPEYRNGGEDTDLCFSFIDRGRTLLYCPTSVVFHHEGYSRGLRDLANPDDVYNRDRLRRRWGRYLVPDISDYCLLAEIESAEGQTWQALDDVPPALRAKYDSAELRAVGRYPFRCEIGSGMNPQPGYLHLDVMAHAPSLDILHDVSQPFPLLEGTVAEILANHVVEHVSWRDLPKLVADLHRVVVPGGRVFIRTPNLRFIAERFLSGEITPEHPDDEGAMRDGYGRLTPGLWANIKLFSGQDYPSNYHYNCMDPQDLADLFSRCGFSHVRLERFGREFSPGEIQLVAEK